MSRFVVIQLMIMMLSSPVVLASFLTKSSVGGDAYLVRGDGDVIPAAGRTVYLLPVGSEVELLYPAFRSAYEKALDVNKAEILGRCDAAKELIVYNKESEKNNLKDIHLRGIIPEGGCKEIEFNLNELLGEKQQHVDVYDKHRVGLNERIDELSRATAKDEVKKIDDLRSDLTNLNDEYMEKFNKISSKIYEVKNKILQCENDNIQKSAIELKINNLEEMEKSIQMCVDGKFGDSVYSALHMLNSEYPDIIGEIPDVRQGMAKEFIKNVLLDMLDSNARSDDVSINGSYRFDDVKGGKYLIFSEYNNNFVEGFWMDEVNVSGDSTVDLNTNNFVSLGFIDYLRYQSEVGCIDCDKNGFSESLLSKNDASSKYRKNKREIEELQLKLENSMRALDSLLFSY